MNRVSIQEIEKLILDPTFRAWCMGEDGTDNARYWRKWINENSYQRKEGKFVRSMVLQLEESYESLSANRKYEAWQEIAAHIKDETTDSKITAVHVAASRRSEGWKYTAAAAVVFLLLCFSVVYFTYSSMPTMAGKTQKPPQEQVVTTSYGEKN